MKPKTLFVTSLCLLTSHVIAASTPTRDYKMVDLKNGLTTELLEIGKTSFTFSVEWPLGMEFEEGTLFLMGQLLVLDLEEWSFLRALYLDPNRYRDSDCSSCFPVTLNLAQRRATFEILYDDLVWYYDEEEKKYFEKKPFLLYGCLSFRTRLMAQISGCTKKMTSETMMRKKGKAWRSRPLPKTKVATEHGIRFGLALGCDGTHLVSLTQQDVRELQLASGAIRAGIDTLLRKAGMAASDLDSILLAGAFGNYIRHEHAMRIGLLPQIPPARIRFIGNASLTGAKCALLSHDERRCAQAIHAQTLHVELATEPVFSDCFMDAMVFCARKRHPIASTQKSVT